MKNLFLSMQATILLCMAQSVSALEVVTDKSPTANAVAAAEMLRSELRDHGKNVSGKIHLQLNKNMQDEEWKLSGDGKKVTLCCGKNGFTLGAADYLENICGLYVFSPTEHSAAPDAKVVLKFDTRRKTPAFLLRDIYFVSLLDGGKTAVRRGLNSQGEKVIDKKYGAMNFYGSPKFCHTFHLYFPPSYVKVHPEWFAEIKGKRVGMIKKYKTQFCLSNVQLREAMFKKLVDFIENDRKKAKAAQVSPPLIYDISMNDGPNANCECSNCKALLAKYGNAQSGVMLDFVNEIAEKVEKIYPEIKISTLAYYELDTPPKNISARDNVIVVLCNTRSNYVQSLTASGNTVFLNNLQGWGKIAKYIRIWDYKINFRTPENELPYNNEAFFQQNLQLLRKHNVRYYFTEFEEPALSDVRDYKLFLLSNLLVNPDCDVNALRKRFAQVYFAAAGKLFLEYRDLLKSSQDKKKPFLDWVPAPEEYTHLDYATVTKAQALFDAGAKLLANDSTRLRRWNFARLSLDRASLILQAKLTREYYDMHKTLKGYPLDAKVIATRIKQTIKVEAPNRMPKNEIKKYMNAREKELAQVNFELNEKIFQVPQEFENIPKEKRFHFPLVSSRIHDYGKTIKIVNDPQSISGLAVKISLDNNPKELAMHTFPTSFGIYSRAIRKNLRAISYPANQIKSGYNWYKIFHSKLSHDAYFYFFRSWSVQQDLISAFDSKNPNQIFSVYVRMKFTGPAFPQGKTTDKNAVYLDSLILIKE